MFDAIAPRYDLVNRIMTFRMDVRWRRRTVASLQPRVAARPCSTWRAAPATSAASCQRRRLRADRRRPVLRDAGRGPHRRPARARRRPAPARCPTAPSTASPAGSPCATSPACRPSSPSWRGSCGPAGRIALLEVAEPPNRFLRWGHGVYFGKVVPLVGGLLSDPAAYRYLPRSVAYLPEPDAMLDAAPRRRLRGRRAHACCRSASPSSSPRAATAADRVTALVARTRRVDQDLDLLELAGARRRAARAGPGGAGRARRGGAGAGAERRRPRSAPSRWTTRSASPARARWRSAPSRSGPTRATELVIPEVAWGRADDGTRWVTTIGPADAPPIDPATLCAPPAVARPTLAPAGHRAAGADGRVVVRAGRPGHQGHARRRRRRPRQGGAGPRGHRRGRRALRPRPSSCGACGRASPAASCSTSTASSAPARSCSSGGRATWCAPSRWPAPRHEAAIPPPTPAWPPGCSRRPPTGTSTRSRSTWCSTR